MNQDVHGFGTGLHETLSGEDVLDFAGTDAESESAEGAVRGGMRVAADDGLAWLSDAEFRADDVDDALILAVHVEEANAGFAAIFFEGVELKLGVLIENGEGAVGGGDGVVHDGEGEIGAADFTALGAKAGEGLRRGAFVNEVAIDIDERRFAGFFVDDVGIPNFLVERFGGHGGGRMILALLRGEAKCSGQEEGMGRIVCAADGAGEGLRVRPASPIWAGQAKGGPYKRKEKARRSKKWLELRGGGGFGFGGFAGFGGIVAFAVDGGNFASGGAEIGGELATVMDGMPDGELRIDDGGKLHESAEIDDFDELLAGEFGDAIDICVEGIIEPRGDAGGIFNGFGAMVGGEVKTASRDAFQEAMLGGGDVPGEFESGLGKRLGAKIAIIEGNGFDNFFGDSVFAF